ncbi:MAG: hypothetical protein A2W26_03995 [Acidobacteria bacterium RBG_16_64_8]|nr:MAG: hypothetical protein A2W26_03995 [Acidobacteria bacterium RBG_16_64_8]
MAVRDRMRESATPYLEPGETVQCVIGAQTASQYLILLAYVAFVIRNRYRIIVVTPRRILVLDAGKGALTTSKARGVVTQLPRATRLGPGSGVWHVIPVGNEKLRVNRRFFKDLEHADSLLTQA